MRASERLRELDGATLPGPWMGGSYYMEGAPDNLRYEVLDGAAELIVGTNMSEANVAFVVALRNVLPLIADVVEAAETYHAAPSDGYRLTDEQAEEEEAAYQGLGDALTALRDALQGQAGSASDSESPTPLCICTPDEGFGWEGRSPHLKGPGHLLDCPMFSTGQEAAPPPEGATAQSDFWRPTGECPEC